MHSSERTRPRATDLGHRRPFLDQVDRTADEEHLSRSALIREALKVYMRLRSRTSTLRFFQMADSLRSSLGDVPEDELELRIDRAVAKARTHPSP